MSSLTDFIAQLAIGAIIWLVLPLFLGSFFKKAQTRRGMALLCKIIGIVVIALAVVSFIGGLFS